MRVMMTTDAVGGVWQYSLVLAHALVERWGCEVALVCFGHPGKIDGDTGATSDRIDMVELPYRLEWMPDSSGDVALAMEEVARLAREWRADVLHSNQFCFGAIGGELPRVVVAHSDVLSWHQCHHGTEAALDQQLREYRGIVAAGLAAATAVVCPSRFMAGWLKTIYDRDSEVIYNGLPPELYSCESKEPLAAVAGRLWDESKLAAVAVQAVEGLPIQLELAGPTVGPNGEATLLPAARNARYLGGLSWQDTRGLLARSRFYLATSSYEPFGLAALEAALSGCVLLAADTPSYREIWGDAAVYYEPRSPADLHRALARLLEDGNGAEALARAARERALARYTADRMATEYYRLYQRIEEV